MSLFNSLTSTTITSTLSLQLSNFNQCHFNTLALTHLLQQSHFNTLTSSLSLQHSTLGVFKTRTYDGVTYSDGGIKRNVPALQALSHCSRLGYDDKDMEVTIVTCDQEKTVHNIIIYIYE